jgi:hypothetical protein
MAAKVINLFQLFKADLSHQQAIYPFNDKGMTNSILFGE